MKFLKIALHKRYFDTGMSVTNYLKYPLLLLGFAVPNVNAIIWISIAYAFSCYLIGWWWVNFGMFDAETEVGNRFNPFVKEVRKKLAL